MYASGTESNLNPDIEVISSPKGAGGRTRDEIWAHFDDYEILVKLNSSTTDTSNSKRLKAHHLTSTTASTSSNSLITTTRKCSKKLNMDQSGTRAILPSEKQSIDQTLVRAFVMNGMSFMTIDNIFFKEFLLKLNPIADSLHSFLLLRIPLLTIVTENDERLPQKVKTVVNAKKFFYEIENVYGIMRVLAYGVGIIQSNSATMADCYLILIYVNRLTNEFVCNSDTKEFGRFVSKVVNIRLKEFQNFYCTASFVLHPKWGAGLLTDCRSQMIRHLVVGLCSNSVIDMEKIEEALSDELKPVENENDLNDNIKKFNDLINENHRMLCQLTNSELISENNIEDKDLLNISSLVNSEDRDITNIFVELGLLDEDVQEQNDCQTASSQDRNDDEEDYDIDELIKAAIAT
ncbi:unnamed protein product [Didymodactylos carnosus]|uniref:Uncharacterized protein n=1 Tax=Didymodactylos carnosus TaxID=1234261 RepID=A0A814RSA3_9BILA|nr:unnamed protein product [Didymodactylos carnosus]CAF3901562.1 unnamed protein product [Didymodactylos carnosus]